jgi:hypothetical protein
VEVTHLIREEDDGDVPAGNVSMLQQRLQLLLRHAHSEPVCTIQNKHYRLQEQDSQHIKITKYIAMEHM